jgi:hypothetical protein
MRCPSFVTAYSLAHSIDVETVLKITAMDHRGCGGETKLRHSRNKTQTLNLWFVPIAVLLRPCVMSHQQKRAVYIDDGRCDDRLLSIVLDECGEMSFKRILKAAVEECSQREPTALGQW